MHCLKLQSAYYLSDTIEICLVIVLFTSERRTVWHESGKSREICGGWRAQYTQRDRQ